MKYLSIDTETTGLDPGRCKLLQLAIVLEDTDHPEVPVAELPYFNRYVNTATFGESTWEPYARDMHQKSGLLMMCYASKSSLLSVIVEAAEWITALGYTPERDNRAWVAGKNFGGFDSRFLAPAVLELLHHRVIDPGSVFMDWTTGPKSLDELKGAKVSHDALGDARDVITVLRRSYVTTHHAGPLRNVENVNG